VIFFKKSIACIFIGMIRIVGVRALNFSANSVQHNLSFMYE